MTSHDDAAAFTIEEARAHYGSYLDGLPLKDIALAILDHVEATGGEDMYFEDVTRAAGRTGIDGEVMSTLSHLTNGRRPALSRVVVYRDGDGDEHVVSRDQLALAQDEGVYEDPVTGERVDDPESRFYLRFSPSPGLLPSSVPTP